VSKSILGLLEKVQVVPLLLLRLLLRQEFSWLFLHLLSFLVGKMQVILVSCIVRDVESVDSDGQNNIIPSKSFLV